MTKYPPDDTYIEIISFENVARFSIVCRRDYKFSRLTIGTRNLHCDPVNFTHVTRDGQMSLSCDACLTPGADPGFDQGGGPRS